MASQSVNAMGREARRVRPERNRAWHRYFTEDIVGSPPDTVRAYVCFSIAEAFPKKIPTLQQLCDRYAMSRSTAHRYRAALKAARGEA